MISKRTSREVLAALRGWAQSEGVEWIRVRRLVHLLNSCQGNQSYRDTMRNLELLVKEER